MSDAEDRKVHNKAMRPETLGLAALAVVVVLALVLGFAGQLAAAVTGRGWPSWSSAGLNIWGPIVGALAHGGDPMRGWPGLGADRPGAATYWLWVLLLALAATPVVLAVRRRLRRRTKPGFATQDQVQERLGSAALVAQADRLRPELARAAARPRPEQLGLPLGRDVSTGVETWASVRQSMYVLGPSESGKTACVVIPGALGHDGPLLLPSVRADAMAATWSVRADRGPVSLFDPLRRSPGLPLAEWDIVRACKDPVVALRMAAQLTAGVDMSGVSDGNSWKAKGKAILRNLLHAAALRGKNIEKVLEWAFNPNADEPYGILKNSATTPGSWTKEQHRAQHSPDKQQAGYYMSVEIAMKTFADPRVLATCTPGPGARQFDPVEFVQSGQSGTLYLLGEESASVTSPVSSLLAALIAEIVEAGKDKSGKSANSRLDPALRLLADEASNTAPLRMMPYLMAAGAGQGIPTTSVIQERWKARTAWGDGDEKGMWGSASTRVLLPGITDSDQLREIASYVYDYDEETRSRTYGEGRTSTQTGVRRVDGLTPARVRGLKPRHALIVAAGGLPLVETEMTPYFRGGYAKEAAAAENRYGQAVQAGRSVL